MERHVCAVVVVSGGQRWSVVVSGGQRWSVVVSGGQWWSVVVSGGQWWLEVVNGGQLSVISGSQGGQLIGRCVACRHYHGDLNKKHGNSST